MTDQEELQAPFEQGEPYTVGLEDEVMVLEPDTFDLAPRAGEVLALLEGDSRFKPELPASQLEIMTQPHRTATAAGTELACARRDLAEVTRSIARFGAAGLHPFSPAVGRLTDSPRYRALATEYRCVAQRELVCALHVHVSVGDPTRALSVYNAARSYLPLVAALAANAPFYEGQDSGLASVRPRIATLLPRQGVPPAIASWKEYAEILEWGSATGTFKDASRWWWELRLHPEFGTVEFRVPDAQSTASEATAVAWVIQALVAWLGHRHEGGEVLPVHPTWMIDENRWLACRDGVTGEMVDFATGRRRPTRELLEALLAELLPVAKDLGAELDSAASMIERNGALAQRAVAQQSGVRALAHWLAERFAEPLEG